MNSSAWLYILAVIINAITLFIQVFFTIMYSDLEVDYVNPIDLCNRVNPLMLPEMAMQGLLTVLFLVTGHWLTFLIAVPVTVYNVNKVLKKQHTLDATEIFRTLGRHKREGFAKLAYYLIVFFFYLYSLIVCLVSDDSTVEI